MLTSTLQAGAVQLKAYCSTGCNPQYSTCDQDIAISSSGAASTMTNRLNIRLRARLLGLHLLLQACLPVQTLATVFQMAKAAYLTVEVEIWSVTKALRCARVDSVRFVPEYLSMGFRSIPYTEIREISASRAVLQISHA
jgi:hypothetical protein